MIFYKLVIFSVFLMLSLATKGQLKIKNNTENFELVLRLSPKANNPRNSEGAFITLKNGNILFIYSHYIGKGSGDHDPAFLAGRTSTNGGKTWSNYDRVILKNEGNMNIMSVSLLRLKNNAIAIFYLRKNSESDCIPMMRISKDEAETWSEPISCIPDKSGYFVLNNDRVIQLNSGRLLMAVALHKTSENDRWSDKAKLYSYYSDDNGKTWIAGSEVSTPKNIITQEPGVVELRNGKILMFIRASGGKQYYSYSDDKGITWTSAVPSSINSPLSPASIKRIPSTGDLLLVWNNNDGSDHKIKGKRTPFHLAISKDEGKTWQHINSIAADPDGWYCYSAIHFYKNNVFIGYCAGKQSSKTHLSVTEFTKIKFKSIY